jgi:xanthine/CO dehydrogenase XdhC/CoxF family maturation factor
MTGARTPAEIAVAILVEIVQVKIAAVALHAASPGCATA